MTATQIWGLTTRNLLFQSESSPLIHFRFLRHFSSQTVAEPSTESSRRAPKNDDDDDEKNDDDEDDDEDDELKRTMGDLPPMGSPMMRGLEGKDWGKVDKDISALVARHYGLRVSGVERLDGEVDLNYKVSTRRPRATYLLKSSDAKAFNLLETLEMQEKCWAHLRERDPPRGIPSLVTSATGQSVVLHNGRVCRLLRFVEGSPLSAMAEERPTAETWAKVGKHLSELTRGLENFEHPAADRKDFVWDLTRADQVVRDLLPHVKGDDRVDCVKHFLQMHENFRAQFESHHQSLRRSVIHGDCNDNNVIMGATGEVEALIDFGDMQRSFTVGEAAIAAAYASLYPQPLENVRALIRGYLTGYDLTMAERVWFLPLVLIRLCVSVCVSSKNAEECPENAYLQISSMPAWRALHFFRGLSAGQVTDFLAECFPSSSASFDDRRFAFCWTTTDWRARKRSEAQALKNQRDKMLGPNLSLLYGDDPIHMVRGSGCFLFDSQGHRYLDAVNNVPHVGHSNPRVAEAVSEAMKTLNTNTRYIREDYVAYAKDLLSTMPPNIEVIYFCNSGSEANDLALRIARQKGLSQGKEEVVVMNGAYHGHTASCIEISPYKFNRSGGRGKPGTTHIMPFPDTCRGLHLDGSEESSRVLGGAGGGVCAFICESLLSCGGQVILPQGYLKSVYANMREAGAVCIADEVQCGFGRSGTHFWGFQTQGVEPDIVVLGKSIGNGFPLSAVATTRDLASTFANGMEYFNTFGGCNAAIAAGHAVFKVLREEKMQESALAVGDYLLGALRALTKDCGFVGDCRGRGLFVGIEFVCDRESLGYAPSIAKFVCNAIRKRFVLVSTDGMHSNTIKIKPPVCFTMSNADTLVRTIKAVLEEDLTVEIRASLLQKDREYNLGLAKKAESALEAQPTGTGLLICQSRASSLVAATAAAAVVASLVYKLRAR